MTGTYAAKTEVPQSRSRDEIERTLTRYGAQQFMYGWDGDNWVVGFVHTGRQIRFVLPQPNRKDYRLTSQGRPRTQSSWDEAVEQAGRQKWRALALVVKAKLEAVEAGIVTFEDEFAMHMVLPDGSTVREQVLPRLALAYESGEVPALLPGPTS